MDDRHDLVYMNDVNRRNNRNESRKKELVTYYRCDWYSVVSKYRHIWQNLKPAVGRFSKKEIFLLNIHISETATIQNASCRKYQKLR